MPKRILITGAAGFIGSSLAGYLARRGYEVLGLDSLTGYYDAEFKVSRLRRDGFAFADKEAACGVRTPVQSATIPGLSFIYADIMDVERLERIFSDFRPDTVVNLAACPGVRSSYIDPCATFATNVGGFFNVLEMMRRVGCRNLVYASSSAVYGDSPSLPFREVNKREQAASVYAATKMCDESLADAYAGSYGFSAKGLRMFSVYGPWGRPDMAPMLFADGLERGEEITLYDHGRQTRDFTYIDDVIESIARLIDLPPMPSTNEIYNIGPGHPVTVLEFLQQLSQSMGRTPKISEEDAFPGESRHTFADSSKLQAVTGYRPTTCLADGIAQLLEWRATYE